MIIGEEAKKRDGVPISIAGSQIMSRRTFVVVILCVSAAAAYPLDWGAFVAASNRGDDGLILGILKDGDFETGVQICDAVGLRKDPYAADILSWLLSGFAKSGQYKTEYLLRRAMKSLFDQSMGDQVLRDRLVANSSVLADMVQGIGGFDDPQLTGTIVRLLPRLDGVDRLPALMNVGTGIINRLRQTDGNLLLPDMGLALDFLSAVQAIGNTDFMDPCLAIARLSRDQNLVQKARQLSRQLAGSGR